MPSLPFHHVGGNAIHDSRLRGGREHHRTVLFALQHDLVGDWQVRALDHRTIDLLTDCRSLEAHIPQLGRGLTSDKRLAIDIRALRQMAWCQKGEQLGDPLYGDAVPDERTTKPEWIETHCMVSDALTKKMKCPQLLKMMQTGWLALDRDKTSKKSAVRTCTKTMCVKSGDKTCQFCIAVACTASGPTSINSVAPTALIATCNALCHVDGSSNRLQRQCTS